MSNSTIRPPKPVRSTLNRTAVSRVENASRYEARTTAQPKPAVKGSTQERIKAASKPKIVVRARLVSYPQTRRHARAHRVETAVSRVLMFLCVAVAVYIVSSISGQVAVEKSRREEFGARKRTENVQMMENSLRAHLTELTRPDKVDDWARQQNLTEGTTIESTRTSGQEVLVASR
jgi:cell division protein FtsL